MFWTDDFFYSRAPSIKTLSLFLIGLYWCKYKNLTDKRWFMSF